MSLYHRYELKEPEMLFEKVSKYLIFDICVDVFFKTVRENFRTISQDEIPKVNEIYHKIVAKDNSEAFYNCRILDVDPYSEGGVNYLLVEFEYDEYMYNEALDSNDDDDDDDIDLELSESEDSVESILSDEDEHKPEIDLDDDDLALDLDDELGLDCVDYSDYIFIK